MPLMIAPIPKTNARRMRTTRSATPDSACDEDWCRILNASGV